MSRFKEKTQGFIMGLMVGLLVAGGFFILKLDTYFKELNFYKSFIHTFTSESKTNELIENNKGSASEQEDKSATQNQNNKTNSGKDSVKKTYSFITQNIEDEDTLGLMSSTQDTTNDNSFDKDEVVVKKDELIGAKTFEVINLNPLPKTSSAKDSLLQRVSGVQEEKNTGKQLFNIEFWKSPLNYKGYKMSKYKIVLFGIASDEGIKVFKQDDAIYLKNLSTVYKLDYANELKPYEKINDESIINKLK